MVTKDVNIRCPTENPDDLTKDEIADDIEWPFEVVLGTVNGFIFVCQKYNIHIYNVRSQFVWAIISTAVFNGNDYCMPLSATS